METLVRSHYEICRQTPSEIDLGKTLIEVAGLSCPRCQFPLASIGHGERRNCPSCGLWMEAWGNSLECTDDPREFRSTPARDVAKARREGRYVQTTPFVAKVLKALGLAWDV